MAKDLTYDFDVCPSIDLSTGVTVAKRVRSDDFGGNTSKTCVVPYTVTNRPTGYRLVWHVFAEENVPD